MVNSLQVSVYIEARGWQATDGALIRGAFDWIKSMDVEYITLKSAVSGWGEEMLAVCVDVKPCLKITPLIPGHQRPTAAEFWAPWAVKLYLIYMHFWLNFNFKWRKHLLKSCTKEMWIPQNVLTKMPAVILGHGLVPGKYSEILQRLSNHIGSMESLMARHIWGWLVLSLTRRFSLITFHF